MWRVLKHYSLASRDDPYAFDLGDATARYAPKSDDEDDGEEPNRGYNTSSRRSSKSSKLKKDKDDASKASKRVDKSRGKGTTASRGEVPCISYIFSRSVLTKRPSSLGSSNPGKANENARRSSRRDFKTDRERSLSVWFSHRGEARRRRRRRRRIP
jgi:hypothetical protein